MTAERSGPRIPDWLVSVLGMVFLVVPTGAPAHPAGEAHAAADRPLAHLRHHRLGPIVLGLAAGLLLLVWALVAPSPAVGAGWLIGLLFWLGIAVGALTLLAIHALTGGRWGAVCWPVLAPAAASIPSFLLFGVPVLLSLPGLFPWATHPQTAANGVARLYLNPTGWGLRAGIALLGWSLLAFLLLWNSGPRRLIAAMGLCFHAVIITLIGIDWLLSIDPRFYSTAFGAALATLQILAALAWLASLRVVPRGGAGKAGDIGGLIVASALGSVYLGFSQYLVIWYGDLPERVGWYIERQSGAWFWVDAAAIALSGILPIFALMRQRWRNDPAVLACFGACVLVGVFLHIVWLLAPHYGPLTVLAALLSMLAIGALWVTLTYGLLAPRLEAMHGR
jgi:hypothetical protein